MRRPRPRSRVAAAAASRSGISDAGVARRAIASSGVGARPPAARLVTYDDAARAESRVDAIATELIAVAEEPSYDPGAADLEVVAEFSANALAGKLAKVLDDAAGSRVPS